MDKIGNQFKILTPHAAVLVWNYDDRVGTEKRSSGDSAKVRLQKLKSGDKPEEASGGINQQGINFKLISTVSCISIQTNKSKSTPAGSFQLVLAPFKNWISTLTTGSWCAILMSNEPITEKNLSFRNPKQVKMFGKIETVRADISVDNEGARHTRFLVTGTDWGHIFNNTLYIDNLINIPGDPTSLGNGAAIAIRNALFGKGNSPQSFAVRDNLNSLMNIFGNNLQGFADADVNRLAKATYDFIIPDEVARFFGFVGPKTVDSAKVRLQKLKSGDNPDEDVVKERPSDSRVITQLINLRTGKLTSNGEHDGTIDSYGYINPYTLQGVHTFWQILLDNSNSALNEMYNEIDWTPAGPRLTLYNRIKPFSYTSPKPNHLRSLFQHIKTHKIDTVTVVSVNAGTNWRDKYNFIEIKPNFQEFQILDNWVKQKSQKSDQEAFNREGFRPFMVSIKQFPVAPDASSVESFAAEQLVVWVDLLAEWYFETHRLLNGTIVITGQNEYIAVGNNIRFDAGLINPTPNINSATNKKHVNKFILAHVESVSHNFTVKDDGAREYMTTIQFVRGISVNENNSLVGAGALDRFASGLTQEEERNSTNTVTTSDKNDPDPQKVRGE